MCWEIVGRDGDYDILHKNDAAHEATGDAWVMDGKTITKILFICSRYAAGTAMVKAVKVGAVAGMAGHGDGDGENNK